MARSVTDEQIAAFVDGILDDREAALVAAALAEDEVARAYAEEVERTNRLLRAAFGAPMEEPVPAPLRDSILQSGLATTGGEVIDLAVKRPTRTPLLKMAAAACVALVVGAGAGALLFTQGASERQLARLGVAPADGPLHAALERLPSGEVSQAGVQPMLTFRDADERICREFEILGEIPEGLEFGIACRNSDGRWQVEIVVAGPHSEVGPEGYRPASGPGADALDAILEALGAQPYLGPHEEAELLRRGWR